MLNVEHCLLMMFNVANTNSRLLSAVSLTDLFRLKKLLLQRRDKFILVLYLALDSCVLLVVMHDRFSPPLAQKQVMSHLVVNWNNWNVTSFRIAEVDKTTVSFFRPDSFDENVSFTSCPQNRD